MPDNLAVVTHVDLCEHELWMIMNSSDVCANLLQRGLNGLSRTTP